MLFFPTQQLLFNTKWALFQLQQVTFNEMMPPLYYTNNELHSMKWCPLYTIPTTLIVSYSTSSLKQRSVGRHVAPLSHIILNPSQPAFKTMFSG
jgi:hypothetical protein